MLSVIVPVLDEAKALPATLAALLAQGGDFEVIVVDGGSRDATCEIVRAEPRAVLAHSAKGRARQMNAGARLAQGEWLLFLHADTILPAGAIETIARLDASVEAGAFRHRFGPRADWRLAIVSAASNLRCRLTRIGYGDQAVFVRAALFRRLGGYPEDVSMLEDVVFGERLRKATRPVLLDLAVTTDARRFLAHGVWRSCWHAGLILARHKLGFAPRGRVFSDEIR